MIWYIIAVDETGVLFLAMTALGFGYSWSTDSRRATRFDSKKEAEEYRTEVWGACHVVNEQRAIELMVGV